MKKRNMSKIALLGLTSGILISAQANATEVSSQQVDDSSLSVNCGAKRGSCSSQRPAGNCNARKSSCGASRASCNAQRGYTANRDRYTSEYSEENFQDSPYYQQSHQDAITEDELLSQLNERGRSLYHSLDERGRLLALQFA